MGAIGRVLLQADRVVLTTHITPDGDGLGSAIALLRFLRRRGKDAVLINCSAAPQNLRFLYTRDEFSVFEPDRHDAAISRANVIVATDIGGSARLGKMLEPIRRSKALRVVIDHHIYENDLFDYPLIWEAASSSAEIAYHLIQSMGGTLTLDLALPLYVGLISDTGNFSYSATSPEAHRIAAQLLECGVLPQTVWRQLTCTAPLAKMRILGQCLSRLKLESGGRVVWTSMESAGLLRFRLPARDAFEVVNHLLHLKDVDAGAFFLEIGQDRTKVSLRSAGRVDVCRIARTYGGGGHRFAAGCTIEGKPLDLTIKTVLTDLAAAVDELASGADKESETKDLDGG